MVTLEIFKNTDEKMEETDENMDNFIRKLKFIFKRIKQTLQN